MRKLLVASQKGGVGKTTTSINIAAATALAGARVLLLDADPLSSISTSLNLAEHPQRQSLRQAGIQVPGVLVTDVIPGLDVLSPYEDGGCSDEELDQLIAMLGTKAFQDHYHTLVVDTPPFMGANPGQLLKTSDEFVLVMRTEPMASRTLPAFLELVSRQKTPAGKEPIKLRGILLTLPDSEQVGGRWERELRGRFGSRILPDVVPYDDIVCQAQLLGQIVCHTHRSSSVSQSYHALVSSLELATHAKESKSRIPALATLKLAHESLPITRPAVRVEECLTAAHVMAGASAASFERSATPPELTRARQDRMPEREEIPEAIRRRLTPVLPIPSIKTVAHLDSRPPTAKTPGAPKPASPREAAPSPPSRRLPRQPELAAPEPPAAVHRPSLGGPAATPVRSAVPPSPAPQQFPLSMGLLWVGVAMLLGIGLRFVHIPDYLIPVFVGLGVAAVVVLVLYFLMPQQESEDSQKQAPTSDPRSESKPASRLSSYTRRPAQPTGRGHGDN